MITFSGVTKRFGDGTVATDNVSFHVDAGDLVVITGPSGSGKTTLMKLLIRDLSPTEGSVIYKDQILEELQPKEIPFHRRKIGVVFQDYRLLPELNVWENIALPLSILGKSEKEIESRVTDLLNLVSLIDRALVFPKQLSGGEAQRVSIARALAMGPSVLFADEPTGNLDKDASLKIMKLFQQINSLGTTVLISTHDVTILEYLKKERQLDLKGGALTHDSKPKKMPTKKDDRPEDSKTMEKKESKEEDSLAAEFKEAAVSKDPTDKKKPLGFIKKLRKVGGKVTAKSEKKKMKEELEDKKPTKKTAKKEEKKDE